MDARRCPGCMQVKTGYPFCEHCGHDERVDNESHQLPIGTVLKEQYVIGKVLGQGGFGITYLGWNQYLNVPVAIKEYFPTGVVMRESAYSLSVHGCEGASGNQFADNRKRFLREAQTLAQLGDVAEVVKVQDFFPENRTAYIVMEYVQGTTLKDYIRKNGILDGAAAMKIFRPVMEGLRKVHAAGMVHRDISPDNIMILPNGGVKLLDFGAVRDYGEEAQMHSTQAILKPGFAPAEQYQTRGNLGPWTDVYALCATIYYCTTGKVPPDSMGRMIEGLELNWKQIPGLTENQAAALEKGMALQAADRVQSVEELIRMLFYSAPVPPVTVRPGKPGDANGGTKKKLLPITVALVAVAAAVGVIFAGGFLTKKEEPRMDVPTVQTGTPTEAPAEEPTEAPTESWQAHTETMMKQYLVGIYNPNATPSGERPEAFDLGIYRDQVSSITFLDSLQKAPADAVDVSLEGNGKVLAWKTHNGQYYDIFIGAEGGVWANPECSTLFHYFINARSIHFNGAFITDEVTNMTQMFYECTSLQSLDVSGFNTAKVQYMSVTFAGCEGLKELDLSSWDTSQVTQMNSMFSGCKGLAKLDLSGFDTAKVTRFGSMFSFCQKLTTLDVSMFDTSAATDLSSMFNYCDNLQSVDVSGFDTSNAENLGSMFQHCVSLRSVDVSGFDTAKCTDFSSMFIDTNQLTNVDGNFDTGAVVKAGEFMDRNDTFNGRPWRELFQ